MRTFSIRELRKRSDGRSTALAMHRFKSGDLTPSRAAKLARMSLPQFLEYVSAQDIAVVTHEPRELEQELAAFDAHGMA